MSSTSAAPEIADRAAGCIVGAFVGDALGLGPHWYYDLDALRRDFGDWIDGYTAPKPGAKYHRGMRAGELSQTGIIMRLLLRSVAECGRYDEADFTRRLDEELLPKLTGKAFAGPGGYTNHSFRQVWQARVRDGKPWGEAGGNADTSEAAERVNILAARYALDPADAARHAFDNCRLSQNDSLVAQQSVAFACVLAALIRGEAFDEQLSDKLMELVSTNAIPFVAKSSIAAARGTQASFGFASPDALLLPSWIAQAARDPGTRIEPAWKVSLFYGMSCAINFVLPSAYYLAARFPHDFQNAVLHAINGGGQNMSRACLTGALVGAQAGLTGIPQRFIDGLAEGREIVTLAKQICRGCGQPIQQMSLQVYGCNHIAIEVGDIEKAVAFYEDVFGLKKLDGGEGDAFFQLGEHQFLAMFERKGMARVEGNHHFGIMVRDDAQIAEVREKLTGKYGLELIEGFRCDFRDPWGNRIQVVDLHDESLIWLLPYREVQKAGVRFGG